MIVILLLDCFILRKPKNLRLIEYRFEWEVEELLTELGRRLIDACENCENLGIESINNGRLILKCDEGEISKCIQRYSRYTIPAGYF
ncbi:MAG: hypothetical protein ACE5J5_02280 [Candidatus Hydrothermarchaeales archaeon]